MLSKTIKNCDNISNYSYDDLDHYFDVSYYIKIIPKIYYKEYIEPYIYIIKHLEKNKKIPLCIIKIILQYNFNSNERQIVLYNINYTKLFVRPNYCWLHNCLYKKQLNKPREIFIGLCKFNKLNQKIYTRNYNYLYIKITDKDHYFIEDPIFESKNINYIYYCNNKTYCDENNKTVIIPEEFEFIDYYNQDYFKIINK